METPKKIRITRKERRTGTIDKSKIPAQKSITIRMNKPAGKSGADLQHSRGTSTTSFQKKDVRTGDPTYGKESKTASTPAHVKRAQAAGSEYAEHRGKSYAAGTSTTTKANDKHIKIRTHPELKMVKRVPGKTHEAGFGKDRIDQKFGQGPKRRMERVAWLKGRNKRTEAGHGNR